MNQQHRSEILLKFLKWIKTEINAKNKVNHHPPYKLQNSVFSATVFAYKVQT